MHLHCGAKEEIANLLRQQAWELDPRPMAAPRHRQQVWLALEKAPPEVKDNDLAMYPIADVDTSYSITLRGWEVRTRTL